MCATNLICSHACHLDLSPPAYCSILLSLSLPHLSPLYLNRSGWPLRTQRGKSVRARPSASASPSLTSRRLASGRRSRSSRDGWRRRRSSRRGGVARRKPTWRGKRERKARIGGARLAFWPTVSSRRPFNLAVMRHAGAALLCPGSGMLPTPPFFVIFLVIPSFQFSSAQPQFQQNHPSHPTHPTHPTPKPQTATHN